MYAESTASVETDSPNNNMTANSSNNTPNNEQAAKTLTPHDIKWLIERVEHMSDDEHWHILQIIRDNVANKFTTNKNGVFVDMSELDASTLSKVHEYVEYIHMRELDTPSDVTNRDDISVAAAAMLGGSKAVCSESQSHMEQNTTIVDEVDMTAAHVNDVSGSVVVQDDPRLVCKAPDVPAASASNGTTKRAGRVGRRRVGADTLS